MSAAGRLDFSDPRRLWSLWEMLRSYAWEFFIISQFVEGIRVSLGKTPSGQTLLAAGQPNPFGSVASSGLSNALSPFSVSAAAEWLIDEEKQKVVKLLSIVNDSCKKIGIVRVENEIGRICKLASYAKRAELLIHLEHLTERIIEELESAAFLHVPSEKAKYYYVAELFGRDVSKKLAKVAEDVTSAGTCYALGQNTACVFHLMRVMEYAVQCFGKKLRISLEPSRSSWNEIMDQVNGQIKALPGGKLKTKAQNARKQRFALAAGRLDHVRIVWRNDVMHPKETYDESQALEVLTSVESFLKSVVDLL